jgi:Ca2+-binding RTX toxin-like protein
MGPAAQQGKFMTTIRGTTGNDVLTGHSGDDLIWGGFGSDVIRGGAGNDVIHLQGMDAYQGNAPSFPFFDDGADTVRFDFSGRNAGGMGHDQVWEFTASDQLQFHDTSRLGVNTAAELDHVVNVHSTGFGVLAIDWKNGSGGIEIHLNGTIQAMQDFSGIASMQALQQAGYHFAFV